jgi:hypothetical protein
MAPTSTLATKLRPTLPAGGSADSPTARRCGSAFPVANGRVADHTVASIHLRRVCAGLISTTYRMWRCHPAKSRRWLSPMFGTGASCRPASRGLPPKRDPADRARAIGGDSADAACSANAERIDQVTTVARSTCAAMFGERASGNMWHAAAQQRHHASASELQLATAEERRDEHRQCSQPEGGRF